MIRVLIVHENSLFLTGLCSVLQRHEELQIVGVVGEGVELEQLLDLTMTLRPHVVLFDGALTSCLPAYNAAEVVDQMRRAGMHGIMVFAPSLNEESLFRFLLSGAAAYEPPTISGDELVERIRRVANGEYLISSACLPSVSAKPSLQGAPKEVPVACGKQERSVSGHNQGKQPHNAFQVTEREITVLEEIKKGCSNKEIAKTLRLSDQTVKNHITSILKKLNVHDRTAAVVVALDKGLISLEDPSLHKGEGAHRIASRWRGNKLHWPKPVRIEI